MNSPMGLRIRTNVAAMTTRGHLSRRTREVEESYARLASGLRITRAGTDPAGLAQSERLRVRTRSLAVAQRNIADGKGLLDVAESAVQGIGQEVVRMRELAIRAASATLTADDRAIIQTEVDQRTEEINRMIDSVQFSDFLVLDGERVEIQIGIDSDEFVTFGLPNARVSSLQDVLTTDLTTSDAASASLNNIDRAIRWVARESGSIGSW
ncbi:MAG: flagellin, partial [Planctomycetota bacterium]